MLRKKAPKRDSGTRAEPSWPIEKRLALYTSHQADGCWLWTGGVRRDGYGHLNMRVNGKRTHLKAHRAAWEAVHGPIKGGLQVLHKCDVPACINPAHLFLGTQRDNIHDMIAKGRRVLADPSKIGHKGSAHHAAKLTESQIRSIRKDTRSSDEVAAAFGVTSRTIRKIRSGGSWKHVPRSAVSKGPARDAQHLAKVRLENCLFCERYGPNEAHHVRCIAYRTMGKRVSDYLTVPLCQACHRMAHEGKEEHFWVGALKAPGPWISRFSEAGRKAIAALSQD